jgi:hypothetical protein
MQRDNEGGSDMRANPLLPLAAAILLSGSAA